MLVPGDFDQRLLFWAGLLLQGRQQELMRPDPKPRVLFMFLVGVFFKIRPQLLLFALYLEMDRDMTLD